MRIAFARFGVGESGPDVGESGSSGGGDWDQVWHGGSGFGLGSWAPLPGGVGLMSTLPSDSPGVVGWPLHKEPVHWIGLDMLIAK